MYPKAHIIFGAIFTALIYLAAPNINLFYLSLIFLSSFLIDFDHYACAVRTTKKLSLKNAFNHYEKLIKKQRQDIKKGIKRKFDEFHFFHTVEFHILIGLLGFLWAGFFYLFIGMFFHSLLDIISLVNDNAFHTREFFFFNWFRKRI